MIWRRAKALLFIKVLLTATRVGFGLDDAMVALNRLACSYASVRSHLRQENLWGLTGVYQDRVGVTLTCASLAAV